MAKVRVVINVFSESSDWRLPGQFAEQIAALDERVELTSSANKSDLLDALPEAEVVFGRALSIEELAAARQLQWIQLASAGANSVLTPEFLATKILLTTASGVHPIQMSEHALAMMLMFARRMHEFLLAQTEARWSKDPIERTDELYEKTLGIIGLGQVGRGVARLAKCFSMTVIACSRSAAGQPPENVDELYDQNQIDLILKRSDYVVLTVPLTAGTTGLISRRELELMKPTAVLINLSRGAVVNESALIDALHRREIGGAGLDVFETEPLPPESPLWHMPNVIITPHVAGSTPRYWERATALFCDNLRRYLDGQPLRNLVVRERGY